MRALVHDPDAPRGLAFADVAEPVPTAGQALVGVQAISLNFGELRYLATMRGAGDVPGWDAAGVVVRAAADGSGPPVGARVTTFGWHSGWAQLRAVDTADLAVVPDSVDIGAASALPVAAGTALQAIRRLGPIIGRRVLVTGASGGVGRFAVQLAALGGADVIAVVGSPERGRGLVADIVTDLGEVTEPVHGVLDMVGGSALVDAFGLLAQGGVALSVGKASGEPSTIDFEPARQQGRLRRIEPFTITAPLGPDLAYLVRLLATNRLDPQIGWRGPWDAAAEAADALFARQVRGKAVLDVQA